MIIRVRVNHIIIVSFISIFKNFDNYLFSIWTILWLANLVLHVIATIHFYQNHSEFSLFIVIAISISNANSAVSHNLKQM